jgi:CheY-like chemotaxis protein
MEDAPAPILCVDDEPYVLAGLSQNLGRRYAVQTATSGAAGLEALARRPTTAVILSDMRMPGMDGATFLKISRAVVPGAVRILLTGQADLTSAIEAVNEGNIFRFLTKPCPTARLVDSIEAAVEQVRRASAERLLLEQTLHGSVKALVEVLAATRPAAFDRASRLSRLSAEVAERVGLRECWQLEAAAMLSQLGAIALPDALVAKLHRGEALGPEEERQVQRSRELAERLLGAIPSLEVVRGILDGHRVAPSRDAQDPAAEAERLRRETALLRVVLDFEALEEQGLAAGQAVDTLRGRGGRYDPALLEALSACRGGGGGREEVRELPIIALRPGMVLMEDVRSRAGVLLAARGQRITADFADRVHRFGGPVCEPVRVVLQDALDG